MSLKRKASYPAIETPNGTPLVIGPDHTPTHLNSRTRKRFRNDRPSEEVVYENTLRWLFSAQQQHQTPSIPPWDEDTMNPDDLPPPEEIDPRQQTLLQFFQPVRPSIHTPSNADIWKADGALINGGTALESPGSSIGSNTNSPSSRGTGSDMGLNTEVASGVNESFQGSGKLTGDLGWM